MLGTGWWVETMAAKYGDPGEPPSVDWVPEFIPEGRVLAPKSRWVPPDEYVKNCPFKLDDPRLIYRIPDKLKKFYGEDRVVDYIARSSSNSIAKWDASRLNG